MVVSPEGRSHSVEGGTDGLGANGGPGGGCVGGTEAAVTVGGGEGAHDSVLDPGFEVGEEGVAVQLDILEKGKVVGPVRSLLLTGGDGDGVDLGSLSSQVSSCEHSSGGNGEMAKSGGT